MLEHLITLGLKGLQDKYSTLLGSFVSHEENLLLQINSMETRHDMDSEIAGEKLDSLQEEYDVLKEKYNELKEKTSQILSCVDEIYKNVEEDE